VDNRPGAGSGVVAPPSACRRRTGGPFRLLLLLYFRWLCRRDTISAGTTTPGRGPPVCWNAAVRAAHADNSRRRSPCRIIEVLREEGRTEGRGRYLTLSTGTLSQCVLFVREAWKPMHCFFASANCLVLQPPIRITGRTAKRQKTSCTSYRSKHSEGCWLPVKHKIAAWNAVDLCSDSPPRSIRTHVRVFRLNHGH
jgi:hypothetical protein